MKDTIYNKIRSIEEAKISNVYETTTPCNCKIKEGPSKEITILVNKKPIKQNLGIAVECSICGNQLGYQKENTTIFMNLIEEDGVCYCVCYERIKEIDRLNKMNLNK